MNYFSLLGLNPSPFLDLEELQACYHQRVKEGRTGSEASSDGDSELNVAYQALKDPSQRLAHLLALAGRPPARAASISESLMNQFTEIASLLQRSEALLQECQKASSPLSRAVLAGREMECQKALQATLSNLEQELKQREDRLPNLATEDLEGILLLHGEFSFLQKWKLQIQERLLQFLSLD